MILGLCIRDRPPLKPLFFGGGQERGLRPGTLPVAHVAALGMAAEMAMKHHEKRRKHCRKIKDAALAAFSSLSLLAFTAGRTKRWIIC